MNDSIYRYPLYYDIAFDRDVETDLRFFEGCLTRWGRMETRRTLELGCGPAYHTLGLARRGYQAIGLDRSSAMLDYAAQKALAAGITASFVEGDMLDYSLESPVDIVLSMLATATHILTMEDMIRHLNAVSDGLNPGGLYILELPHPRDFFRDSGPLTTVNQWSARRDGVTVEMKWGTPDDPVDAARQIRRVSVTIMASENGDSETYSFTVDQGVWTVREIKAAVMLAGCFELCALFGDFDLYQEFNNSKWSWRLIPVLRKIERP